MTLITIKLQAYIPKSLGKPLLSYFNRNVLFDRRLLSNYDEFKRDLESYDRKGFTWLPEPGSMVSNCFFGTDDADFHNRKHTDHNQRLNIQVCIKPEKIGKYSRLDKSDIFTHTPHNGEKVQGTLGNQHSGLSHRVEAYIKRIPFNMDGPRASSKDVYIGMFKKFEQKRSEESQLTDVDISNTYSGYYFSAKGKKPQYDTSVIEAVASAPYPYLSMVAPNIDMGLKVTAYLNKTAKLISIKVEGIHNMFPAYELLVNDEVLYSYFPKGYTGPTPFNLNQSKNFSASYNIRLSEWDMNALFNSKSQKKLFSI